MIIQPVSSFALKCDNLSGYNAVTIFKCIFISKTFHKNNKVSLFWLTGKWISEDLPLFSEVFLEWVEKAWNTCCNHPSTQLMSEKRNSVFTLIGCNWRVMIWEILISFSFKNLMSEKCYDFREFNVDGMKNDQYMWQGKTSLLSN